MPIDWRTANSRFRVMIPVRMALKKFSTPTSPTIRLSTPPSSRNMERKLSNSAA